MADTQSDNIIKTDLSCIPQPAIVTSNHWHDYALIDSGNQRKLERFGKYRFIRPEPQAMWSPRLDESEWKADGTFIASHSEADSGEGGGWKLQNDLPSEWLVTYQNLRFFARPTPFRHLGFFPEQAAHWNWCADAIKQRISRQPDTPPRILNLFAYSGVASLHAAAAGADVTHLDASKKAVAQAFENRDASDLQNAPIRFITDDAMRFVEREIRRGRRYDGIIMDPPKYGRGPKGEFWRIEEDMPALLKACRNLLSDNPLFMVLTIYAIRASSLVAHYAMAEAVNGLGGTITSGELAVQEETLKGQLAPRVVSQANFARWRAS
ncbi:class I SAM-dependent methyltransferase [Candidatus Puniceispirillum sp.]|jgi:23S rRNA (cytosine1962-C5)-methyltransferase|uniref:class I SAM-dependent methyltransferase n=1 Tax=uncultured Candidatus Puniceispirillum sp. TaxID=1985115 RepID=UPI001ED17391|nr:class I SAM-dependent rRNA methyltransferase [Candidatus Puniceispirillum sp.]MBT6566025.1 class I SAM-dependent rRNA methyltransferase [Candidatus Puniceispirillum sp.]